MKTLASTRKPADRPQVAKMKDKEQRPLPAAAESPENENPGCSGAREGEAGVISRGDGGLATDITGQARFKIGDLVIYGNESVFKVAGIGAPDIPGTDENRIYYTLLSVYRDEKVFTPVDTTVFMRPVISGDEAKGIINHIPNMEAEISCSGNPRILASHYQALLQSHDCMDMVRLIATVNIKGKTARENGGKINQTDVRYKRQAEELLDEEFAVALGIPKEQVRGFIEDSLVSMDYHGVLW